MLICRRLQTGQLVRTLIGCIMLCVSPLLRVFHCMAQQTCICRPAPKCNHAGSHSIPGIIQWLDDVDWRGLPPALAAQRHSVEADQHSWH